MAEALKFASKMGWGAAEPVSEWLMFDSCDGGLTEPVVRPIGIAGTRDVPNDRNRSGLGKVDVTIKCTPTPAEWDIILPRLTGGTKTGNDYPLAETIPSFYVWVTRGAYIHKYSGCVIGSAVLESVEGGPLTATMQIFGIDENTAAAAGTFPAGWTVAADATPYMFHDAVYVVNSLTKKYKSFRMTFDNMVNQDRFLNSNRRTSITSQGRMTRWELSTPYGGSEALHGLAPTGVAAAATFTQGGRSLTITSPSLAVDKAPVAMDGEEWYLPISGLAGKSGSSDSVTFSNDVAA